MKQQELPELLAQVLEEKKAKLQKVRKPAMLLILDQYGYADTAQWLKGVSQAPARESFHSIYRIVPPGEVVLLWAAEPGWSKGDENAHQ